MKILWSWLTEYLKDISVSPQEALDLLTLAGTEGSLQDAKAWARPFCVALIESVEPHPHAEALSICRVKTGKGNTITVVCGASNVRPGLKSFLAQPMDCMPGSKVPLGQAVLRGVVSEGMLCSAEELWIEDLQVKGVFNREDGILEVHAELGTSLADLLPWEALLDLEVTPNRGDLLSHLGVARELAALKTGLFVPPVFSDQGPLTPCTTSFSVMNTACPQFMLASMTGILNTSSPAWMRRRLAALGVQTHSFPIDMTNYVCYDLGRPSHVFDADAIEGPISVDLSSGGERFLALNDEEVILPSGLLVVKDRLGVLSLAGVMGGMRGRCTSTTKNILIESAEFDAAFVTRAGRETRLMSQSRYCFERGIDSALVQSGGLHLLRQIQKVCGGEITGMTYHGKSAASKPIVFNLAKAQRLMGVKLTPEEVTEKLTPLGAQVSEASEGVLRITPPSWRQDWNLPEQCAEECLRLNGYTDVPSNPLPFVARPGVSRLTSARERARRWLVSKGLFEVVTWSFLSRDQAELVWDGESEVLDRMTLQNPISQDMAVMRPSALPNLMQLLKEHQHKQVEFMPVFEEGACFQGLEESKQEINVSALFPLQWGRDWQKGMHNVTFYDVKGLLMTLLEVLEVSHWDCISGGPSWFHPHQSMRLMQGNCEIATLGRLHPRLQCEAFAFELHMSRLAYQDVCRNYVVPALQAATKDLSFFLPSEKKVGPLIQELVKCGAPELMDLHVLEVFHDPKTHERSMTFRVRFQPKEKSFTDEQLHHMMDRLICAARAYGAVLRGLWE
jgi:phenylalanyl-tRNA synthetase beta chain